MCDGNNARLRGFCFRKKEAVGGQQVGSLMGNPSWVTPMFYCSTSRGKNRAGDEKGCESSEVDDFSGSEGGKPTSPHLFPSFFFFNFRSRTREQWNNEGRSRG